jgi:hypothetical protein
MPIPEELILDNFSSAPLYPNNSRQLFAGLNNTVNVYFILRTTSDFPVTAGWEVSFSEELQDTISASTVYTMGLTASILGSVLLLFGVATIFFFFYKVPPSHPRVQRI